MTKQEKIVAIIGVTKGKAPAGIALIAEADFEGWIDEGYSIENDLEKLFQGQSNEITYFRDWADVIKYNKDNNAIVVNVLPTVVIGTLEQIKNFKKLTKIRSLISKISDMECHQKTIEFKNIGFEKIFNTNLINRLSRVEEALIENPELPFMADEITLISHLRHCISNAEKISPSLSPNTIIIHCDNKAVIKYCDFKDALEHYEKHKSYETEDQKNANEILCLKHEIRQEVQIVRNSIMKLALVESTINHGETTFSKITDTLIRNMDKKPILRRKHSKMALDILQNIHEMNEDLSLEELNIIKCFDEIMENYKNSGRSKSNRDANTPIIRVSALPEPFPNSLLTINDIFVATKSAKAINNLKKNLSIIDFPL